ncbi:unnamed protein product [Notodromas monacha]|uniref:J domain-containing protein n=1 Tax=Notodromas monacha TaxID=399045 RepID=A0A7R9BX62_9CRUS|nr:unnamed protein product [Notodromas monacha]CAG0922034.1 unnamed protein product [Notodromas monacha]
MENERERQEYVLNDTGKIYVGSFKQARGRRWVFAQFDDTVLPASIMALELAKMSSADRSSPIKVARAISAIVNQNNENGIVHGRWDGSYADGTAPYDWTGSASILEKYLESGGKPIKYGQCWVFAGVAATICRALGIPCRPVSNFVSAHDTDATLTVDKYFDVHGEEIQGGPSGDSFDSIWNFHVWNEVWMTRPDLPQGYGGWQVIDSTPQEQSDSIYQLGPTSVLAVKRGEVGLLYDTPFVFSEVNADVMHWLQDLKSDWGFSLHKQSTDHVGRKLLTKNPYRDDDFGDSDALDITLDYKDSEGSNEERMSVMNAVRGVEGARRFYNARDVVEDVTFELADIEKIGVGKPFRITVTIVNKSNEIRTIKSTISAASVYYTGVKAKLIKKSGGKFAVRPRYRETLSVDVTEEDYLDRLVDYGNIKIYALATVEETKQTWSAEDDFIIEKPILNIQIRDAVVEVGKPLTVAFSFKNPLNATLTDCRFMFEGPGLQRPRRVSIKDITPRENVVHTEKFTPKREGKRKIVATFASKQLIDITGSTSVMVKPHCAWVVFRRSRLKLGRASIMGKNLCLAYFLYLIGGFCGLHQLYLNRSFHALAIFTTCGAFFGLGIIRDFFWIPTYVRSANNDGAFIEDLADRMRRHPKPPFSWSRYGGQLLVGMIWGSWFVAAIPENDIIKGTLNIRGLRTLMPAVCALGTWLVGNIGHERGNFKAPLLAGYLAYFVYGLNDRSITSCTLASASAFNKWSREWRRTPSPRRSLVRRLFSVVALVLLFYAVVFSYLYFNCSVKDNSGVETRCKDAFINFLNSPAWKDFKVQLGHLWTYGREHGWSRIWKEIINSIDPLGEQNALEILGLDSSATQEDITSAYRKLSRQWHPDRFKEEFKKIDAQEKFIEIQQAYEKLSDIKAKRRRQNRKSQTESDSESQPEFNVHEDLFYLLRFEYVLSRLCVSSGASESVFSMEFRASAELLLRNAIASDSRPASPARKRKTEKKWMNKVAECGQAYRPTEVEHVANIISHAIWIFPSTHLLLSMLDMSVNVRQSVAAWTFGSALILLFLVSTLFHVVSWIGNMPLLKEFFHRGDRAMIYIFIAASYFPWLTLLPLPAGTFTETLPMTIWVLASLGILYQQIFHEQYKWLEMLIYMCVAGIPGITIALEIDELHGLDELGIGGLFYIIGMVFFKSDGRIPFAHAIWHLHVICGSSLHYSAICRYLLGGSVIGLVVNAIKGIKSDMSRWRWIFCDERLVNEDSPDSTYGAYKAQLGSSDVLENFILPRFADPDAELVADDYETKLKRLFPAGSDWPSFDLLILGVGEDGHTASLFPGHELLSEDHRWVAPITDSPKPPPNRVTLTLPAINHAKQCVFAAFGAGKADILKRILVDGEELPAFLVNPPDGKVVWILDEAAGVNLPKEHA